MIEIQKTNKDILAKLMATENITVIHKQVPTAYFDVKSRTLCCPVLKEEMSPELTDLFMGHEVGHALNTPLEGWHSAVSEKGMTFKGYLNVIEDVRIEKKIKTKYPGLRRSFFAGYKELANNDFFGIRDTNIHELNLIDRINLFYKIGSVTNISFNQEEQTYINKCEKLETFEEVLELATELFERQEKLTEDNLKSLTDQEVQDMINEMIDNEEDNQEEESDSMSVNTDQSEDEDEDEEGSDANSTSDSSSDDSEQESNSTDGSDSNNEDTSKNGQESKDETVRDGKEGGASSRKKLEDELNKSISDEAFRNKEEELYDDNEYHEPTYFELPGKLKYENYIIDHKEIDTHFTKPDWNGRSFDRTKVSTQVKTFMDSNKKIISYMVKEFEMKKAAADYKRSWSAKSGELDMSKLPFYQLKDDIFNRIQVTPEGKNHGVVMILDWSGSMCGSVKATVEQATLLSMFCRRLSIPFKLFAFSDSYRHQQYPESINNIGDYDKKDEAKQLYNSNKMFGKEYKDVTWDLGSVKLLEVYNEKMSNKDFTHAVENWFQLADSIDNRYVWDGTSSTYDMKFNTPDNLYLGGTPLDHSLLLMRDYLDDFKMNYNIDVCSFITLTDGSSHSCLSGSRARLIDRKYNKVQNLTNRRTTHGLLNWIRETTGSRTIGFYISTDKSTSISSSANLFCGADVEYYGEAYDKARKEFANLSTSFTDGCYDLAILINQKKLKLDYEIDELKVEEGANKGTLKRALVKAGNSKMKQRVILNQFVGQMAV